MFRRPWKLAVLVLVIAAGTARAADDKPDWVEPMKKVHAGFKGTKGTFAQFGDSITMTLAFWAPLQFETKNMDKEATKAYASVKGHMKPECWRGWKGQEFGNLSSMTVRWAHQNVDGWLKKHNPEAAVIMFGTNDLNQLDAKEYETKLREVVDKCLKNGTVVILTTIPPRAGMADKSKQFADIARKIGKELQVPVIDYAAEVLKRRPDDWDGSLAKFKDSPGDGYQVPTLIGKDGVHPTNPDKFKDFSEESLKNNGFLLRNYLTLLAYGEVIDRVLAAK